MSSKAYTRRSFLETIAGATVAAAGTGLLPSLSKKSRMGSSVTELPDGATVLFQGDSITDAGRDKREMEPNRPSALGHGYAFLASAALRHSLSAKNLQCYNRGISGNKVFQLAERWETDCISLSPDVLSLLIGVNDFWHTLDSGYDGTAEIYENDYRMLLDGTLKELPGVQLIIGEPFVVVEGSAVSEEKWYPEFRRYQEASKEIARDFGAAFVPYQSVFDKASEETDPTYWTADGVHPTVAGSQLMAQAWLETFRRV